MEHITNQKIFNKNFSILALGQLISLLGNSLQRFALSLYILDITGSAAIFSTVLALTIIPQVIVAPFGGAIADRFSKKKIMVALDFLSCALLLVFFVLLSISNQKVLLIGILTSILAIIQNFYDPTVRASIPAITAKENLTKANSVVSQISAITLLIGPIAAGFIYGFFGIYKVFVINIISFFLSAIMELFLTIPFFKQPLGGNALITFTKDIKNTLTYLYREKKIILSFILIAAGINLFITPLYLVGVPYVEKVVFHVSDNLYGISEGCIGAGMIVGSAIAGIFSKTLSIHKLPHFFYLLSLIILSMGIPTLGFLCNQEGINYPSYILLTIFGILFALCIAIINIVTISFIQLMAPQEKMGKIMALATAVSSALLPIGSILFGFLYEVFADKLFILYFVAGVIALGTARFISFFCGCSNSISDEC
jgi:Major Facilitator Superfamily.